MRKLSLEQLSTFVANIVSASKISNASFVETRDNTVGLLDKIGKIITLDTTYTIDKLARFDGEYLSYGKTIEEWQEDLIMPESYDATGANALAPATMPYRPVFYSYTLERKKVKATIYNNDLERAVHNEGQFIDLITMKTKRLNDSMAQYRYALKRELLGKYIGLVLGEADATQATTFVAGTSYSTINTIFRKTNNATDTAILVAKYTANDASNYDDAVAKGFLIPLNQVAKVAKPVDTSTGEAFLKQVKKDIEVAGDVSEGYSLNGNTLGATDGLVLIVKQGIMPDLEVETFAGAFNRGDLAVNVDIIVLPDFGGADSSVYAVLMDGRGMRLHNTYNATRDNANGDGDFLNIFRHTEDTAFASRNTFIKVYQSPSA